VPNIPDICDVIRRLPRSKKEKVKPNDNVSVFYKKNEIAVHKSVEMCPFSKKITFPPFMNLKKNNDLQFYLIVKAILSPVNENK
jgi:hypothetical protein